MYENEIYSGNGNETNRTDRDNHYFDRVSAPVYEAPVMGPIPQEPVKKVRKKSGFWKKAAYAIGLGIFFGAFAGLGFYGVCKSTGLLSNQVITEAAGVSGISKEADEASRVPIKTTNSTDLRVVSSDVSEVVDEVMPAMVSILNNATEEMRFWGQTYTRESASSGTGIIIGESDEELLIVTNHHVAVDATKLEVTFIDGNTAEANIKGMDSDMDLAVIAVPKASINEDTKNAISIATLGDSEDLKLGKPVIVIGNALGYGQSVTDGIISGLNRELEMEDGSKGTFIQTNAAVNPGNSGGALLNIKGEVIGIVSSKIGGSAVEGMGYAIPISSASPIISDLMSHQTRGEKVAKENMGYMGIELQEITSEARLYYNMPAGVFVYNVMEGSAAEAAGIKRGDIIVKVEGEKIASNSELQNIMQYYATGDTIKVTVSRQENGEYTTYDLQVTLGKRP